MQLIVKRTQPETKDIISIIFKKPKGFQFYPAQFIDIGFPKDKRIMSFSSSPTEIDLMITFKKGTSIYKQKMQKLKAGQRLESTHPAGTYTLDENSPAVMLAAGVGITPHRSMIKYAVDHKLSSPLTLIYSNSDSNFPFKKELDKWQKIYPNLKIHYIETRKLGRLDKKALTLLLTTSYQLPIYYLAGTPSFVSDMEKILKSLRVDPTNIRLDSFDGY